ncbi:Crp/Fnr family transcriptional regulator [Maribellus sp. YY47]|uniref:Crp/Fnr family transcriptional regulator n=1 Tax=Maribellus sp. YY47 TaxID=2929486 RepID=UPI002000E5D7|nr:Crp/Fnr family transcriptional regulator [Maribellus sp. YY47]MCK3686289.1 Crp/Fnr family transcriptional regulator [Maribellus sp. YY47]
MADYSILYSYFEHINKQPLTPEEMAEIHRVFRKNTYKKKTMVMKAGEANTLHYYIEKGLLRMYIIDQNGKEFNILFARERQWIGDLGTPAETPYFIETVEDSIVYSISEENFHTLYKRYIALANYIRKSYVFLQKRFVSILSKTAEENYEELVNDYPGLLQRLPQYQISSYLGVTPVFLSKILAKRAKKD